MCRKLCQVFRRRSTRERVRDSLSFVLPALRQRDAGGHPRERVRGVFLLARDLKTPMSRMSHRSKSTAHLALAVGLVGVACSQPRTEPAPSDIAALPTATPEGSAWIEGRVEDRQGARVCALDKSDSRAFFSTTSGADGRYRIGPLPPAEYEVRVMWTLYTRPAKTPQSRARLQWRSPSTSDSADRPHGQGLRISPPAQTRTKAWCGRSR